jgi:tryptophan synthase alpha chain
MSEKRIMAHMVAYYPDRAGSVAVAKALEAGGCAYLEIQFPFSDPTADGPDIQAACTAALAAGFSIHEGFRLVEEIHHAVAVPIFLMSYANLLFTHGMEKFLTKCFECGAAGVIVPDLPPDYDEGLFVAAKRLHLFAVPVVSPSMREQRLRRMGLLESEYIYATLRTGTTGPTTRIDQAGVSFLQRLRALNPGRPAKILGGFGVSTARQVEEVMPHVHAVVVGSALVREVAKGGDPYPAVLAKMKELAAALPGGAALPRG